jgi:hypothetical protein
MAFLEGGRSLSGPHAGIYTLDRVSAIREVAGQFGLPFQVLAHSGEGYPDDPEQKVPSRYGYIQLGTGKEGDMSEFWKQVDEICLPRGSRK